MRKQLNPALFTEHCIIIEAPLFPAEKCPLKILKLLKFKRARRFVSSIFWISSGLVDFFLKLQESMRNLNQRYFNVFDPDKNLG